MKDAYDSLHHVEEFKQPVKEIPKVEKELPQKDRSLN
jgi:hypothetical protein